MKKATHSRQSEHRELKARLGDVLFYGTFGLLLLGPCRVRRGRAMVNFYD